MLVHAPSQNVVIAQCIAPQIVSDTTVYGIAFYSLAMYERALLVFQANPVMGNSAGVALLEASAADGTGSEFVDPMLDGIMIEGNAEGSSQLKVFEVNPYELSNPQTRKFIGAIAYGQGDVSLEAHFILMNPRKAGDPLINAERDSLDQSRVEVTVLPGPPF